MRRYMMWTVLTAGFLAAPGCHCCSRPCPPDGVASAYDSRDSWFARSRLFHPLAPRAAVAAPPPGAIIVPPGGVPPAPAPIVPAAPVPVTPAPDVRSYSPPAPEASERLVPESTPPTPQGTDQRAAPPALPEGIPGFVMLKKRVAAGQRPTHLEGLEWLKNNGYRMALYIRAPGDPDDADRKQFEDKCGMKYASLVVSPEALTLDVVEQFNAIVSDPVNRPLFVYDKDGSLAGALWYLHFRMIDQKSDEDARAAAGRLGLKEDNREMWLAIQKILSGRR